MSADMKRAHICLLFLIANPQLTEKASDMFNEGAIPFHYMWNAVGTAPSELIDVLGLGSPEKRILITTLPKSFAEQMLTKFKKELMLGTKNSGIAFTIPLTGVNNLILRMFEKIEEDNTTQRKGEVTMTETKHSLITVVINQGHSEMVMEVARKAGASGGTVVHGKRIGNKEALSFWGMTAAEEKEMLFIVTDNEKKLNIMKAIGEECGMKSEAQGIVLSLPIEAEIGLND